MNRLDSRYEWLAFVLFVAIFLGLAPSCHSVSAVDPQPTRDVQVCFAPGPDCRLAVIREINAAKTSIDVHAYGFTDPTIAHALVRAQARGVRVRVLGDIAMETGLKSQLAALVAGRIDVRIDHVGIAIAHIKSMIFDGSRLAEGSFNWTPEAEHETNEMFVFSDSLAAYSCAAFFDKRWAMARKPKGP